MDSPSASSQTPPLPPPPTSLAARLLNVFATPGEVFEEVRNSLTSTGNWLVPALLSAVVGVVTVILLFSQPVFVQHTREQWASGYEGMVKAGKISQTEADKAVGMIEKFAPPLGCVAAVAVGFCRVLWWAFVLWLLGRLCLGTKFTFMKSVEVAGLATMISVLGGLVALLLSVNFGKLSGANLDLLLGGADPKSKLHPLLVVLDVFNFWLVGVMSAGLARLAGVRFGKALFWVVGYWFTLQCVMIAFGLLMTSLMSAAK